MMVDEDNHAQYTVIVPICFIRKLMLGLVDGASVARRETVCTGVSWTAAGLMKQT